MNQLTQIKVPYDYHPKVYTYQKPDKRWYWKYKLPGGAWFYCPTNTDEKLARRNAAKKAADLAKGLFNEKELEKIQRNSGHVVTIDAALEQFLDSIKLEHSMRYYENLNWVLKSNLEFFKIKLKIKEVHKVKEEHLNRFRDHLLTLVKKREIKAITANGKLKKVKRFFKWLKKRKIIFTNPGLEVDPIKVDFDEQARVVATPPDIVSKLMNADYKHRFDFPIKELAFFLFATGARLGEALHMEVDDLDLEKGEWIISKKKDCPTKYGLGWTPKMSKARTVPLAPNVVKLLRPLVTRAKEHKVVGHIPTKTRKGNKSKVKAPIKAHFIFTMKDRTQSSKDVTVYRRVDDVRGSWGGLFVAAGLAEPREYQVPTEGPDTKHGQYKDGVKLRYEISCPYTRHDMRRGFNAEAEKAGMELKERCAVLGHNPNVNQKHYGGEKQVDSETLAEKVKKVSESNVIPFKKCDFG